MASTSAPSSFRARRSRRAFTLLELIVVIVVLGLLAALAIPTFQENIDKSHDEVAQLELAAMHEEAWAVAALDKQRTYNVAAFVEVEGDYSQAATAGVFAADQEDQNRLQVLPIGSSSEAHGFVSIGTNADGTVAGLAMRSRSGRCAWVQGTLGNPTLQGAVDAAAGDCVAANVVPDVDTPIGGEPEVTGIDAEAAGGDREITVSWAHVADVVSYTATCAGEAPSTSTGTSAPVAVAGEAVGDPMAVTIGGLENFVLHTCSVVGATAGDPIGSDDPTAIPTTTIADPTDPFAPVTPGDHLPDTSGDGTPPAVTTIHEPIPVGAPADDPADGLGADLGLWAAASFPAAHPSPPHRLYVTARDAGAIVQVTDTGTGGETAMVVPAGTFADPTGIVAGPTPSHEHVPDAHVLDALYVTDAAAGTLHRIDPGTRAVYTVASGFTNPMDVAISACWDAAGARAAGTCALVVDDAGTHQVNLATGATTPIAGAPAGDGLIAAPGPQVWVAGIRADLAGASVGTVAASGMTGGQAVGSTVYVADTAAKQVVVADTSGAATAVWGTGGDGQADGPVATATFTRPTDVHYHGQTNVTYVVDGGCVRKVDAGTVSSLYCGVAPSSTWVSYANSNYNEQATDAARTADGGVVVVGSHFDPVTFGPDTVRWVNGLEGFVAKVDSNGNWLWAADVVGGGDDIIKGVDTAPDGSLIVTGFFTNDAEFGPGGPTLTAAGRRGFVAKLSSAGDWQWARAVANASFTNVGERIVATADGGAIAAGWHTADAANPTVFGSVQLPGPSQSFVWVAKIDSSGTWQWAVDGGNTSTAPNDMVASGDGGVIVAGHLQQRYTATFGTTTLPVGYSATGDDAFVAKVTGSGSWAWATATGGAGTQSISGVDVKADGAIVVTGKFQGTSSNIGGTVIASSTASYSDGFVAELPASGGSTWTVLTTFTGAVNEHGGRVAQTPDGKLLVTARHESSPATFGSHTVTRPGTASNLAFAELTGSSWSHASSYGGTGQEDGVKIISDSFGTVVVGHYQSGGFTFGSSTAPTNGGFNLFVANLDTTHRFG